MLKIKLQFRYFLLLFVVSYSIHTQASHDDREKWLNAMIRISHPVLVNLANDSLKTNMPVFQQSDWQYLEAFGRTFCGMSRWLELKDETQEDTLRNFYRYLVVKCLVNGFDPKAKDCFNFETGKQPLVDAAYLAQGLIRCPRIWEMLNHETQDRIVLKMQELRRIDPPANNWLLFASMVEAFLYDKTGACDNDRLWNGINSFVYGFYVGDGFYGDGKDFVLNYYNSYVIHPMLADILLLMKHKGDSTALKMSEIEKKRYMRYVQLLERQIGSDGSLPVYGRTVTCRLGMLNALGEAVCLFDSIPNLPFEQVRDAMTAALDKQLDDRDFDADGFLKVGFQGEQHRLAEDYISAGSSYHCVSFFLPLGLPEHHRFWSGDKYGWTNNRIYAALDEVGHDEAYIEGQSLMDFGRHVYYQYLYLSSYLKGRVMAIALTVSFLLILGIVFIIYMFIRLYFCYRKNER